MPEAIKDLERSDLGFKGLRFWVSKVRHKKNNPKPVKGYYIMHWNSL